MSGTLLVLGAGGHGKVVAETAIASGWSSILFLDDALPRSTAVLGWPIAGRMSAASELIGQVNAAIVAVGDCGLRLSLLRNLSALGYSLPNVIHPTAVISPSAHLGRGVAVLPHTVVSVETVLGDATIINHAATVDHGCNIGDGAHICPGAHLAGDVTIGPRSWIGIGASIVQGVRVGSDVLVGAGAVVVHDVENTSVVYGVPAKRKKDDAE